MDSIAGLHLLISESAGCISIHTPRRQSKEGDDYAEQGPVKETKATDEPIDRSAGGIMKTPASQDKNSSFCPRNHVSSGREPRHLHKRAGCNQGAKPGQAICRLPNSCAASPLIIPSADFPPSSLLFSPLLLASSSERDHGTSHSAG